MSAAELTVGAVTRRRARTRASYHIADGIVVMVLMAATLICYSYYNQMRAELDAARAEHARIEAEAAQLSIENARIASEVEGLKTNPEVIERAARERLGMVRPGEIVLAVARDDARR